MIPEAKAKELLDELYYKSPGTPQGKVIAKDHAIFCCNEIIGLLLQNKNLPTRTDYYSEQISYWQQVKEAIKLL